VHRICTNRPNFNEDHHESLIAIVKGKVEKTGKVFYFTDSAIDEYCETKGMMGDAKKLRTSLANKYRAENDPLPDGALTYLEELWLENNYNFHDLSLSEQSTQLLKGHACEDDAIKLLSQRYGIEMGKNEERKVIDFLTGECDVTYSNVIRDVKVPETWKGFRSKKGITTQYHWQLIAYCHLYNCNAAYLDYVFMPVPEELMSRYCKGMTDAETEKFFDTQESIKCLLPHQRIKTYRVETNIHDDIQFMLSRLAKAKEYYETLTYEKCMKMAA